MLLMECLDFILPSLIDLFNFYLASPYNASSKFLSQQQSEGDVKIAMILTTIDL